MDIVLTTNSPGEVAAWLTPAVRALRRKAPYATITVAIPPCTFASGSECAVVAGLAEVDFVLGPRQFMNLVLFGRRPRGFSPGRDGVVCFLGGDLLYGAWLARRLKYPAVAYTEGRARWEHAYRRFLVPDQRAEQRARHSGVPSEQIQIIGDLMLDAVKPRSLEKNSARAAFGIDEEARVLSLFPGSRGFELKAMLPFFTRAAEIVDKALEQPLHVLVSLSPFADEQKLKKAASHVLHGFTGSTASVESAEAPVPEWGVRAWRMQTEKLTLHAYQGLQYDVMRAADIAVTVPGSNTAEMAALGVPFVVAVPLNRPEDMPLEGPVGVFGRIPLLGPVLKRAAVRKLSSKLKVVSLPNRKAGEMVAPEVRGVLQPEDIAIPVLELLQRPKRLSALGERLKAIMGEPGASERLADAVLAVAHKEAP